MKTERVQLLIEMIQKSIKCALEIQQEPSPTLADYEFHARLIQQVNIFLEISSLQQFICMTSPMKMKIADSIYGIVWQDKIYTLFHSKTS